jgi:4-hydroxy-2-oxoheptanedioate aldolase
MATVMKNANKLGKALKTGSGLSFGAWQMLPGTHLSRAIARTGFDWVCIDTEHGNIAGMPLEARQRCHIQKKG